MDDTAFAARLAESGAAIERELDTLLGADPRPGEPTRPEGLILAMRYATLGGGKRLPPIRGATPVRARASESLPDPASCSIAEVRAVLCAVLAHAIGLAGMVGGQ